MVKSKIAREKSYGEHFKGKKTSFSTNTRNQSYITEYLDEIENRSDNAYKVQKSVLYHFFEFIYSLFSSNNLFTFFSCPVNT